MLALALGSFAAIFFMAGSAVALGANATITDAATLVLDGLPYRLHGIDAPETDQICLKDDGTIWGCGIEARDKVREFVSTGAIKCESLGFDARYRNRRIGRCWVDGAELNDWIVRQGWALNSEPHARGRFKPAEAEAKSAGRGLWKGCFALPKHWRYSEKQDAVVQGSGCQANDSGSRERLFTRHPSMPA